MSRSFFNHFPLAWILGCFNFSLFYVKYFIFKIYLSHVALKILVPALLSTYASVFLSYIRKWNCLIEKYLHFSYFNRYYKNCNCLKGLYSFTLGQNSPCKTVFYLFAVVLKFQHNVSMWIFFPFTSLDAQWVPFILYEFCLL